MTVRKAKTYWTELRTVAHVAGSLDRDFALSSQLVERAEGLNRGILGLLVESALEIEFPTESWRPGFAIAQAVVALAKAESLGSISRTSQGLFESRLVKAVFRPSRGRGRGRGKAAGYDADAIAKIQHFMRNNAAVSDVELAQDESLKLPYSKLQVSGAGTRDVTKKFREMRRYARMAAGKQLAQVEIARAQLLHLLEEGDTNLLPIIRDSLRRMPDEREIERWRMNLSTWPQAEE